MALLSPQKSYRRQNLSYLLPNHVSSVRIICLVVFNNHRQIDEPKLQVGTAIYMFDRYFLVVYSNFLYWPFPGDVCLNGFSHGLHNGLLSYLGLLDDPNHWWIHLTMNSDRCWHGHSWHRGWILPWNQGNRTHLFFVGFGFHRWSYHYFLVCFHGYIDHSLVVNFLPDYSLFLVNFVICIRFWNFDDPCFPGAYVSGLSKPKLWTALFWSKTFAIPKNTFWSHWSVAQWLFCYHWKLTTKNTL